MKLERLFLLQAAPTIIAMVVFFFHVHGFVDTDTWYYEDSASSPLAFHKSGSTENPMDLRYCSGSLLNV